MKTGWVAALLLLLACGQVRADYPAARSVTTDRQSYHVGDVVTASVMLNGHAHKTTYGGCFLALFTWASSTAKIPASVVIPPGYSGCVFKFVIRGTPRPIPFVMHLSATAGGRTVKTEFLVSPPTQLRGGI
jgi:hypothetical protein